MTHLCTETSTDPKAGATGVGDVTRGVHAAVGGGSETTREAGLRQPVPHWEPASIPGISTLLQRTVSLCASLPRRLEDLQLVLGRGRSETYRHVGRGIELGLLTRVSLLRGVAALIVATDEAHRLVGSGLTQTRLGPAAIVHAATCSAVAARLALDLPGREQLSDAELRREEALAGRPIASAVLGEREGRERLHRPDIVLLGAELPTAIEVELSPKAPQRLLEIVGAWRRASHLGEVVYICRPGVTQRAVLAAVKKAQAQDRVRIVELGKAARG